MRDSLLALAVLFSTLACCSSAQPTWVAPHFHKAAVAPFTIDGTLYNVPAGNNSVLVCFVVFTKRSGTFSATLNGGPSIKPIQTQHLRSPSSGVETNTTAAFLFHVVDMVDPLIRFSTGVAASGTVHCDQFTGVSGLEHFGSLSIASSTSVSAGYQFVCPNNIIAFGTFSTAPGVSSLTLGASSTSGTVGPKTLTSNSAALPKQSGTTGFFQPDGTDPVPTGYSVFSTWGTPSAGLSVLVLGLSGCPTTAAETMTCPATTSGTCVCRGSYCVVDGTSVPVTTDLVLSSFSNIAVNSGTLVLGPTARVTANISSVYAGPMLSSLSGTALFDGQLTVIVSPAFVSPASGARTAQISAGTGGTFSAISYVSTDPCQSISGVASSVNGLSVTLTATALTTPACSTCATIAPTCVHGTCTDSAVGPSCQPCPSDGGGFGFIGAFCDGVVCLN